MERGKDAVASVASSFFVSSVNAGQAFSNLVCYLGIIIETNP